MYQPRVHKHHQAASGLVVLAPNSLRGCILVSGKYPALGKIPEFKAADQKRSVGRRYFVAQ